MKIGDMVRYRPDWCITQEEETLVFMVVCSEDKHNRVIIRCINEGSLIEQEPIPVSSYMLEKIW